jgi:hypothetical protein
MTTERPTNNLRDLDLIEEPVIAKATGFAAERGLPVTLIGLMALLILSDLLLTFIEQPPEYWVEPGQATTNLLLLQRLIALGPLAFTAAGLLYTLVVTLLMVKLPRPVAFILYLPIAFIHLYNVAHWLQCGVPNLLATHRSWTCHTIEYTIYIILTVILALLIVRSLLLSPVTTGWSGWQTWGWRFATGAAVIWLSFLLYGVIQAAVITQEGWIPVATNERPLPRTYSATAYDAVHGQTILFGGAIGVSSTQGWRNGADTWVWDGQTWAEKHPPQSPPSRYDHSMAYDEGRNVTVLFGGNSQWGGLNDTWIWEGEQWVAQYLAVSPPARWGHQLIYNSERQRVTLYGGYFKQGDYQKFYDDAWEWDGASWYELEFDTVAPQATNFKMVYDRDQRKAVAILNCNPLGTWIWENRQWSKPTFQIEPPPRANHDMTYDPLRLQIVLFGGYCTSGAGKPLNDTWILDNNGWREITSPRPPAARWGHVTFFDPQRQSIMLFGGYDGHKYLNDMWELTFSD